MSVQRVSFDAAELVRTFPPNFTHPNKRLVMEIACPGGITASGTLAVSRWQPMGLPIELPPAEPVVRGEVGFFTYASTDAGWCDWHVNFADPVLFGFYGGGLFAQDEMQVTEHPALASIPRALEAHGIAAYTVEMHRSTPVLVKGVERRCVVDTAPSLEAGRISGLYGNRFARASELAIRSATRRIDPPTISNIIAIAALRLGRGAYTRLELDAIVVTALTGFRAAVLESEDQNVRIHTGFWGCGAFGGNRVLMVLLQMMAARLAGVDELVVHLGDADGSRDLGEAQRTMQCLLAGEPTVDEWISRVLAEGYVWGHGDGN